MTTFLLQHPLQNHRGHNESLAAYRKRRTEGNKAVKAYLKGAAWRHVSARSVKIPALGVDPAIDREVLEGRIRDVKVVLMKNGDEYRVGREKGKTYRKVAS